MWDMLTERITRLSISPSWQEIEETRGKTMNVSSDFTKVVILLYQLTSQHSDCVNLTLANTKPHQHAHTNAHTSRAPQAWHAGTAHYYNAKLLVAKET